MSQFFKDRTVIKFARRFQRFIIFLVCYVYITQSEMNLFARNSDFNDFVVFSQSIQDIQSLANFAESGV